MIFVAGIARAQLSSTYLFGNKVLNSNYLDISSPKPATSAMVTPAYYLSCLGFFCKKELKVEQVTGIPIKFRLGSVQYVDYMEGKHGRVIRP